MNSTHPSEIAMPLDHPYFSGTDGFCPAHLFLLDDKSGFFNANFIGWWKIAYRARSLS